MSEAIAISLSVADELMPRVRLGIVAGEPVVVREAGPRLIDETRQLTDELVQSYAGGAPAQIEQLGPARELYRSFGIDPTKTRPSSEALLRRALQGKPFPRIINAVDLCNLLALRFLLPIGLYDAAKIRGDVLLRRGLTGESFAGIRKGDVHLEGRPVLVDREGPFGNPTSDSLRTAVTAVTRSLWMVIFAPASVSTTAMEANVGAAREGLERHLGTEATTVTTRGTVLGG